MSKNWLELLGDINRDKGSAPLYAVIFERIKNAIDSGELPINSKLPTNRELAVLLDIDRSTASRAYAELNTHGYIESFVGRGTFVRSGKPAATAAQIASEAAANSPVVWTERFSKASQTAHDMLRMEYANYGRSEVISFAGGIPTDDSYPHKDFERILNKILSDGRSHELFQYSPGEGMPSLRHEVLKHLRSQNIEANDEKLLIICGSQQGLDVVSSILIDPGDMVVAEDPTYLWATCNFRSRQARCLPVPLDEEGIRIDMLESVLQRHRPKFIYVIPNFQNPTGVTMSLQRRHQLLDLAIKYQVPILEDNFVGDLRYDGVALPSLRALPGSENIVIHLGTFSKALCPALRLGWLVAPPETMARLVIAKRASNLSTNSISQLILADFLKEGLYEHHLVTVRDLYRAKRDTMLKSLQRDLGFITDKNGQRANITWSKPEGGMFVWVKLPDGLSSRELLSYSQQEGVTFAPGDMCFANAEHTEFIRLCFIQLDEATIVKGLKQLAKAIKSYIDDVASTTPTNDRSHLMGTGTHSFI
ncbi:MAG: PLP-dependent aminotransferase family protein [Candidatus Melainabacteria bacterium]|nr:PLP-dependent aminotransferase family protein [Candidatus Melainabacteria bacterium]